MGVGHSGEQGCNEHSLLASPVGIRWVKPFPDNRIPFMNSARLPWARGTAGEFETPADPSAHLF